MKPKSSFFGCHVGFLVLQVMTSMSEKWIVTTPTGHLVATVGGQAELSCQLSPPRSAKHMEVGWFRGGQSKLVHLYRGGQEVRGEAAPEYVDRTEFVKEAIGDGRVTLRLHNISISDNGPYQCSFKDSDFSDVASMNLSVAALGLVTQIHVQAPGANGLMVECNSGGWFPQPQMEWRDNKGEVVPYSSKSYSKDGAGLFHMKMTLLLRNKSKGNMICYICNPLIGEGKQTNIILADDLFETHHIWMAVLFSVPCGIILFLCCQCFIKKESKCYCIHWLNSDLPQLLCFGVLSAITIRFYLQFRNRASISDPLFVLYNDWIRKIAVLVFVLMVVFILLFICLYVPLKGCFFKLRFAFVMLLVLFITLIYGIYSFITYFHCKNTVSSSDPNFQLKTMWLEDMVAILCVPMVVFMTVITFILFRFRVFLETERIKQASDISLGTLDKDTTVEQYAKSSEENN